MFGEVMLTILWVVLGILGGIVALVVLWLLFAWVLGLFVSKTKEYRTRNKFYCWVFNVSLFAALMIARVKVHVEGEEKLPKDVKFLMVSNHVSNFDSLATSKAFVKYKIGVISKPSNFKVPFFGRMTRRCCYYPIDRENARNAVKTINLAADVIKNDQSSILVYPEGTRNKSAKGLLPFHNSVFKVAQKAACPIVVITVRNSETVHKRTPFKRSHVYVKVLEVISAEEAVTRTADTGARVEALMRADEEAWLASKEVQS
ncbi:MAG: 1-acyl-sn-glycerol-3-phosphate acyltransferase [Clostridia bacterium]|nr:1-acyl-sn-glycerol-3-phosphate acyltransferase [Clostridia bacterium]